MPESPPSDCAQLALLDRAFRGRREPLAVAATADEPAAWRLLYANAAFLELSGRAGAAVQDEPYGALFRGLDSLQPDGRGGLAGRASPARPTAGPEQPVRAVPLYDEDGAARLQLIRHGAVAAPPVPPDAAPAARLLDAVTAGLLVHREFRPLYANAAAAKLLGLASAEEVLAEPTLLRFVPMSNLQAAMARHDEALAKQEPIPPFITHGVTAQGSLFWAEVSETALQWDGEAAVALTFVDASDHARARKSEILLREAVDNLFDSFILYDADDRVVLTNRRFHEIFPFLPPQNEITGATMVDLVRSAVEAGSVTDPTLRENNKEEWIARFIAERHNKPLSLSEDAWPDGRWDLVKEQRLASGGFVSVRTDITDRKRGEFALKDQEVKLTQALAERTKHLEAVLANIAQGVIVLDPDLRVVLTNPGLHEIVGYSRELGKPGTHVEALIRDRLEHGLFLPGEKESGQDIETIVARRLQAYRDLTRETFQHPFPNGREVEVRREKLPDGSIICTFTDVTERVAVERELRQQREALYQREKLSALGMLLAGVAHELNNPLSVVLGQAALMESLGTDRAQRERAGRIRKAAERCAKIIKTFLAMARGAPASRTVVRLNDQIEQALELVDYQLRHNDIAVVRKLAPELPEVTGDPDQLNQVVTNLLINAIQAMEDSAVPRRITIGTASAEDGTEVELQVCDSGPGVPEEVRRQVFDPFFTTKPAGVGTGVGLSVCHAMVSAHGGSIVVDEAPGGGARFRVRLPRAQPAAPAGAEPKHEAVAARPGRVLVVDDEPEICDTVAEFLEVTGLEVEAVTTAEEALERLTAIDYDVVVCDLRMPGMDGRSLYEEAGRMRPALRMRFIFATGDLLTDSSRRFLQDCGRPCLEKPLMPEQVRRLVAETAELTRAPAK
ncbi:MAG: PAS-domain containing protein [Kiloniellales bacterium]